MKVYTFYQRCGYICTYIYISIDYINTNYIKFFPEIIPDENVCAPSPCGPNSKCKEVSGQAVCSCLPSYIGTPPACRPECVASSECPSQLACKDYKCVNPCPSPCGLNTNCVVVNHSPICSCMPSYSGDPFTICTSIPRKIEWTNFLHWTKSKICLSNTCTVRLSSTIPSYVF